MTNQLPAWIQYLQAFSTPSIALLALVIGVMQWRTSHQRAVLDLFEKRWETYMELRFIISEVLREGSVSNANTNAYLRAIDRAEHLFGKTVTNYLKELRESLRVHHDAEQMLVVDHSNRERLGERRDRAFETIAKFYDRIEPLVARYLRMHQKAPWF